MLIDYKGGKELYSNNLHTIDSRRSFRGQWMSEDLLTLRYDDCDIDVGKYGVDDEAIVIHVLGEDIYNLTIRDYLHPVAIIPCFNYDDFYAQLQRAIDTYPGKVRGLLR